MTRETVFILKVVPKDFWGGKKRSQVLWLSAFDGANGKWVNYPIFLTDAYLPSKTSEFMFDSSCRVPYIRPVTKNTHPVGWLKVWQNHLKLIHPKIRIEVFWPEMLNILLAFATGHKTTLHIKYAKSCLKLLARKKSDI